MGKNNSIYNDPYIWNRKKLIPNLHWGCLGFILECSPFQQWQHWRLSSGKSWWWRAQHPEGFGFHHHPSFMSKFQGCNMLKPLVLNPFRNFNPLKTPSRVYMLKPSRWFKVTFLSPKGSRFHHPKKVTFAEFPGLDFVQSLFFNRESL